MAEFTSMMLTSAGKKLASSTLLGDTMSVTKIVTTDSQYEVEEIENLTDILNKKQVQDTFSVEREAENTIKVNTTFDNKEVTEGYYVRAIGLYAKSHEGVEILYAVAIETTNNCYMSAYNGIVSSEMILKIFVAVDNSENVEIYISEGSYALEKDFLYLKNNLGAVQVTFEDSQEKEDFQSGEALGTILGKIKKWFTELKAAAFAGLANNCTTTVEGYALDARQGKVLQDEVAEINSNLNTIKTNFTDGCSTIAAAITSQGVSTAANASPATMAANIKTACTNKYNAGVAAGSPHVVKLGNFSFSSGETAGQNITKSASFTIPAAAQGKTHYVYAIVNSGSHDPGRGQVSGSFGSVAASSSGTTATVTANLNSGYAGGANFTVSGYCICIY